MPPEEEGDCLRAALEATDLRGAFPPVDLRAVCFVRAISVLVLVLVLVFVVVKGLLLWSGWRMLGKTKSGLGRKMLSLLLIKYKMG